ncbi:MAG TPA: HD domain-containing phosphohydrolase [Usitatibacter sp.]|nr:HD domain-containing phosphohydrolase [Usitatibacter sp.]
MADEYCLLARKIESPSATRLGYNLLGMVHADTGNIGEALQCYLESMELAKKIGDAKAQCCVLNNIGTALNYAGLYPEAGSCFRAVIAFSQPHWSNRPDEYALSNLAQTYYYLEDLPAALDAIQRSVNNSEQPVSAEAYCQRTIREFMYVQIALELDQLDVALRHLDSCRRYAYVAGSNRCKTMAAIASARCDIVLGRIENGFGTLEEVLIDSRTLDSGYRDALIAIVKAYDNAERPELALEHMESLVKYERERRTAGARVFLSSAASGTVHVSALHLSGRSQTLEQKYAILRARVAERQAAILRSEMLERLAGTADLRDDASGQHGFRVGRLAALLASRIGWSEQRSQCLEIESRLHDIGKIGIPDRILGSSQSLRDIERHFMMMHTTIGADLLAKSAVPQLRIAEEIARYHHERWDGSGYPRKLSGANIPIHARIVALADVFDALTHGRPFSPPWDTKRAIEEISRQRGRQFDPGLTDAFIALIQELNGRHPDLNEFLSPEKAASPIVQIRKAIKELVEEDQNGLRAALH